MHLSVTEEPQRRPPPPPPATQPNGASARPENVPPRPRIPPPQSDVDRRRFMGKPRGPNGENNVFADPSDKSRERRPRRNSDTSIREKTNKLLDPNDDRRRRERRQRDPRRDGKPRGPNRCLDVIDKLDVTSIYGTGRELIWRCNSDDMLTAAVFHHWPEETLERSLGHQCPETGSSL